MHRLIINQLGPIQHCKLDICGTTILTGYQASGKSTIAKAVYFFRSLKEDLLQLICGGQQRMLPLYFCSAT